MDTGLLKPDPAELALPVRRFGLRMSALSSTQAPQLPACGSRNAAGACGRKGAADDTAVDIAAAHIVAVPAPTFSSPRLGVGQVLPELKGMLSSGGGRNPEGGTHNDGVPLTMSIMAPTEESYVDAKDILESKAR